MNRFGTMATPAGVMPMGIIYGTDVFCALVQRAAAPINRALTSAIAHLTPGNTRSLQSRWDTIITTHARRTDVRIRCPQTQPCSVGGTKRKEEIP